MPIKVKQRGSGWSIRFVIFCYKTFGYIFIYYLMYLVSLFYYFKAGNVKEALKIYYQKIGVKFSAINYYTHVRHFAICMCDRFVSLIDQKDYKYKIQDEEVLRQRLQEGGILLLSHYGGWASAANCFKEFGMTINVVMDEALMKDIKEIEECLQRQQTQQIKVIDAKKNGVEVVLAIFQALRDKELVAIMADRPYNNKSAKAVEFFGKKAYFNKNPFEIAYKTNKSLIPIFVRYKRPQEYVLDHSLIKMNNQKIMKEEVERCMGIYVKKFEESIKKYPQGWFNFYDFWNIKDFS